MDHKRIDAGDIQDILNGIGRALEVYERFSLVSVMDLERSDDIQDSYRTLKNIERDLQVIRVELTPNAPAEIIPEVEGKMLRQGKKVEAIFSLRNRTNIPLQEAKEICHSWLSSVTNLEREDGPY
jgi:hypothetical protein